MHFPPRLITTTFALLLTACAEIAPAPRTPAPIEDKSVEPAAAAAPEIKAMPDLKQMDLTSAAALIKTKLRQNGQYLFCDQPGYLQCYQISRAQCLNEVNAVKQSCIDKVDAKYAVIQSTDDLERYSGEVSSCLAIEHARFHDARAPQISACIKNIKFDSKQRDHSLFQ